MQIIVLEYDVRYNLAIKENYESEFTLLNDIHFLKDEEINFLKNRISTLEEGENTEELFYQEINKIRDLLREKTSQIIKLEHFLNQTNNEVRDKINQIRDQNEFLVIENEKLKEILKDILNLHANSQKNELENLLNFVENNKTIYFNINQNYCIEKGEFISLKNNYKNELSQINSLNYPNEDNDSNNFNSSINNFNNHKEDFTDKVLNEFDKIFNDGPGLKL